MIGETRVGIKEKMVLEMPSGNRQCQSRRNMVSRLFQTEIPVDEKDFEVAIDVFLNGADMYRRGGPEWSWRCVSWKNLSKVQRLLVVRYLESSCSYFEIDSLANREPVQASQNWCDVAVPRHKVNTWLQLLANSHYFKENCAVMQFISLFCVINGMIRMNNYIILNQLKVYY